MCFTFLKPTLGHQNVNQGKYANIHSSIFFSSHDILPLNIKMLSKDAKHFKSTLRRTCVL